MKQKRKVFIVIIIFIVLMGVVLIFFMNKYSNINIINKANSLLSDLYSLKEGNYKLKDGIIVSNSGSVISKKYYFDGNGNINIDKYGNVRFNINYSDKCVSKTSVGSVKLNKGNCNKYTNFVVNIIRNNSKISFTSNKNNLSYKLSYNDDFKGKWVKFDTENLILNQYREGKNYIWFKDSDGNISDVIEFEVDCLDTKKANYNKKVFYCSGSTVVLDNYEWIVIEDNNRSTKLMKYLPIDEKMSHCTSEYSEYCYYSKSTNNVYTWENSYINYYLNNIFIEKLSDEVKNNLEEIEICNEYDNYTCDNESCGGYSKEEIEYNNYTCNNYIKSKIKIISFDEYNYVYGRSKDKKVINGNYWAINSYTNDKGSSVQYNYDFYILEDLNNKLDIKPVIVIRK